MSGAKRRTGYRKTVTAAVLHDLVEPAAGQCIAQVARPQGTNLVEVVTERGDTGLAMLPTKFRKLVWIKRGDYLLVAEADADYDTSAGTTGRVRYLIETALYADQVKHLRAIGRWPAAFDAPAAAAPDGSDAPAAPVAPLKGGPRAGKGKSKPAAAAAGAAGGAVVAAPAGGGAALVAARMYGHGAGVDGSDAVDGSDSDGERDGGERDGGDGSSGVADGDARARAHGDGAATVSGIGFRRRTGLPPAADDDSGSDDSGSGSDDGVDAGERWVRRGEAITRGLPPSGSDDDDGDGDDDDGGGGGGGGGSGGGGAARRSGSGGGAAAGTSAGDATDDALVVDSDGAVTAAAAAVAHVAIR